MRTVTASASGPARRSRPSSAIRVSPAGTQRCSRRPPPQRHRSCATSARVGGNLAQAVRCWYYRHPDLTCWLNGGDTCYAQIGDHRKHGLEAGDCISVAPSDLAAPLAALGASVTLRGPRGEREIAAARPVRPPRRWPPHRTAARAGRADRVAAAARAAGRLALRARGRARRVVVRARRGRGRAPWPRAAPRRDRRHERAARARPCRPAARARRARADGLEAAAARGAQ